VSEQIFPSSAQGCLSKSMTIPWKSFFKLWNC